MSQPLTHRGHLADHGIDFVGFPGKQLPVNPGTAIGCEHAGDFVCHLRAALVTAVTAGLVLLRVTILAAG